MKRVLQVFLFILFILWSAAQTVAAVRKTALGLATVSAGTWTVYGDLDGFLPKPYGGASGGSSGGSPGALGPLRRIEYNKIAVIGFYGTVWGQPAFAALPWLWTANVGESGRDDRVALGDGEFYLGQKAGGAEWRLGLIFPAGYDIRDGDPWMGPGNLQVTLGAAFNPNLTRYSRRWEMSSEAKWAYTLDDAIAKSGTWGLYPSGNLCYRPGQPWKFGLEGLGYWKSSYWGRSAGFGESVLGITDSASPKPQWGAGLVAGMFVEHFLNGNLALGLKAGHGIWGYRDAATYNASVYLLYFP
ncbi:MAG: hypothetical protein ABI036_00715 [Fibrobacteria bacterium]